MAIRQAVADFLAAGPLPDEGQPTEIIARAEGLLHGIEAPVSNEEAWRFSPDLDWTTVRPRQRRGGRLGLPPRSGSGHRCDKVPRSVRIEDLPSERIAAWSLVRSLYGPAIRSRTPPA